jgi:hypothetical protein
MHSKKSYLTLWLLLIVFAFAIMVGGCGGGGGGGGDDPIPDNEDKPQIQYDEIITDIPFLEDEFIKVTNVKLKHDVYTLLDDDSYLIDETLVISPKNKAQHADHDSYITAADLPLGSVLIVPSGLQIPSGIQGKIQSKNVADDKISITYSTVEAEDIFDELRFEWNLYCDERSATEALSTSENRINSESIDAKANLSDKLSFNLNIANLIDTKITFLVSGAYDAKQGYDLNGGLKINSTVLSSVNQKGASKRISFNRRFGIGSIPMGLKCDFGVSASVTAPTNLAIKYEKNYHFHVNIDGTMDTPTNNSEIEAPSRNPGTGDWNIVLTPSITPYLYVGVESNIVRISGGVAAEVKNDFDLTKIKPGDISQHGEGYGLYSQFNVGVKLLARTGVKITLFKLIKLGYDAEIDTQLKEWSFPQFLVAKLWGEENPAPTPTPIPTPTPEPTPTPVPGDDTWDGNVDTSWYSDSQTEFTLTTAAQLAGFANLVNGSWSLGDSNSFSGKTINLGANIDLNNVDWSPIGAGVDFSGIFDGKGYTISNLTVSDQRYDYFGLFGTVEGSIKNLKIANAHINGDGYVAALAGYLVEGGAISGCAVTNAVIAGMEYVGGLVGWNEGAIRDCTAIAEVTGMDSVGGLVGTNTGSVSGSQTSGNVRGLDQSGATGGIGGLIGGNYSSGTVSDCTASSSVHGEANAHSVGGLVGINGGGSIRNCTANGRVSGTGSAGGLVGLNYGTIVDCKASGEVSSGREAGGLVAHNSSGGTVSGCDASGRVSIDVEIPLLTVAGGFIAYNEFTGTTITNNFFSPQSTGQQWGIGYDGRSIGPSNNGVTPR